MKLNPNATYSRSNSSLLENGVEILRFTQHFPVNIEKLGKLEIEYHEKYITANPEMVEWLIEEEEQLGYFQDEIKQEKVGKTVKVEKMSVETDPSTLTEDDDDQEKPNPTLSRKEQVRWYLENGTTSPKTIAEKLGTNASYVQRLKKEIENE